MTFTATLSVGNTTVNYAISPNAPILIPLYTGPDRADRGARDDEPVVDAL